MKKQTEETIDEQIEKCWYSRWVAIREDEYQCVLKLLEDAHTSNPEDKMVDKTLVTFKRNQDIHYRSREEHREMMEKGILQPAGGRPNG